MMDTKDRRPVLLCILDGWGSSARTEGNAIFLAHTPHWDRIWAENPHCLLQASEGHVGLPIGQMGNSEVGHMNIGAGRLTVQDLPRIDQVVARIVKSIALDRTRRRFQHGGQRLGEVCVVAVEPAKRREYLETIDASGNPFVTVDRMASNLDFGAIDVRIVGVHQLLHRHRISARVSQLEDLDYADKRVVVIDADSGEFKRYWGAYGNPPDDTDLGPYDPSAEPAQQFRNPVHCAELAVDRLLYVCDRVNDRIQVFRADGTFVAETFIEKQTLGAGSVWEIAFSRDQWQTYMYVADGVNERIHILRRDTLEYLTSFGDGGRQPGQFYGVHSIATDSQGNLFTTETFEGKRIQKFVYKGIGNVARGHQGVVWPSE